tara:strand:- start:2027 stop:2353 length:327 start_codon:yes stop_codon:yes gene_type:complete
MESIRKYLKLNIKRQVGLWAWIGRVAPLSALLVLSLILYYDIDTWLKTVLVIIGIIFSITAFTWWWWVIYAVRDIFTMLNRANKKFEEVLVEIKKIKLESTKLKKRKK